MGPSGYSRLHFPWSSPTTTLASTTSTTAPICYPGPVLLTVHPRLATAFAASTSAVTCPLSCPPRTPVGCLAPPQSLRSLLAATLPLGCRAPLYWHVLLSPSAAAAALSKFYLRAPSYIFLFLKFFTNFHQILVTNSNHRIFGVTKIRLKVDDKLSSNCHQTLLDAKTYVTKIFGNKYQLVTDFSLSSPKSSLTIGPFSLV